MINFPTGSQINKDNTWYTLDNKLPLGLFKIFLRILISLEGRWVKRIKSSPKL